MATTLYLVRHGETKENLQHILQGHLPGELTARGKAQLEQARKELASLHFDALLTSDLRRCIDSSAILIKGRNLKVHQLKALRERDWGSLTGAHIRTVDPTHFPADVESVEAMYERAGKLLAYIRAQYPDKTLLVVSHGLFCRALLAANREKTIREIPRMDNAEVRIEVVEEEANVSTYGNKEEEDMATAD